MTKYTHKNGRYARGDGDRFGICKPYSKDCIVGDDGLLGYVTEQELLDFGFEKEKDKYEECLKEIIYVMPTL